MTTLEPTTAVATEDPDATRVPPIGPEPDEAVAERVIEVLDHGAACVLASIGHELGLFETLARVPGATSDQLADAAGLDERYVREWLAGVVSARFVRHDPERRSYALREDHAPFLTGPGPDNLARQMRYVTMMGEVTPKIVHAFRHGGGPTYADYPQFHELMAQESAAVHDVALVDVVLPLTGRVADLERGIRVADVGCGEGHAVNLMARAFPASSFVGYDFNEGAVAAARAEAGEWGLANARFEVRDVAGLEVAGELDLVTVFDAVHDQAHPATVLAACRRALRPDGTFLMVDFNAQSNLEGNLDLPWATFLYTISTMHCMAVSLGQGGDGLGTAWGVQLAERMLGEAGFTDVTVELLDEDPFNAYFVARP